MAKKKGGQAATREKVRAYISQTDIPSFSLEKAIKIPDAIGNNYGYRPSTPLQVATALEVQLTSSYFKMLTGASIAYGLTNGGYNAATISITQLGMRIVRPTAEGDDLAAKREAFLRPRVIREFLQKYNNAPIPKGIISENVLQELGVPKNRTAEVLGLILEGAEMVGFLQDIKDRKYVGLGNTKLPTEATDTETTVDVAGGAAEAAHPAAVSASPLSAQPAATLAPPMDARVRRVFITHGKSKVLIEPIKKLLAYGELEAVVAVQIQTVSQPVPGKVMSDMRSCGAAIILVEDERHLVDKEGNEHIVLNDNVLIEVGAAMALFGQRFILVVKEGVKLPSNIQGLLELRYKGDMLDMEETVKLLEAINDMKKRPLPQK